MGKWGGGWGKGRLVFAVVGRAAEPSDTTAVVVAKVTKSGVRCAAFKILWVDFRSCKLALQHNMRERLSVEFELQYQQKLSGRVASSACAANDL